MSAPEPTAEHIAEARDLFEGAAFIDPYGRTIPLTVSAAVTEKFARAIAAAEARGFERGQKTNPSTVWGWAAASGGDGWLLCPMVLRGDRLVVDADDVRGMIFGEPGREGYAAVRRLRASQYTPRVRRKTMEGARSALSKLMGESIPALPDSKEPR